MRYHSQNLNERNDQVVGSIVRHGRCWWNIGKSEWKFEWSLFKRSSIGLTLDLSDHDDDALGGHVSIGFAALHWGWSYRPLRRIMERLTSRNDHPTVMDCCQECRHPKSDGRHQSHPFVPMSYWSTNGRTLGIRWFEGTLWIDLWNDPMESHSNDPWWWHISITPVDVIFGRTKYSETELSSERVVVPMPEGGYAASVRIFESMWRRPRWPWAWRRMVRSEIKPDTPIPFPGKGENAWDCGEDATHSMTGSHETAFDAAMALSRSVMRDRVCHGGWKYLPEAFIKR